MAKYKNGIIKVFGRTKCPVVKNKHTGELAHVIGVHNFYGGIDNPLWAPTIRLQDGTIKHTQLETDWILEE